MKAQAAIVDALFLMFIASASASLLYFISQVYGSNTSQQFTAVYNYDYLRSAVLVYFNIKDEDGEWFIQGLKERLSSNDPVNEVAYYFSGKGKAIKAFFDNSPSPNSTITFSSSSGDSFYCYKNKNPSPGTPEITCKQGEPGLSGKTVFTSSFTVKTSSASWKITLINSY